MEQTVRRRGEAIEFGLLHAGERLPAEQQLAERLQISMVTLREALAVLRGASYIATRRGRDGGTFVQPQQGLKAPASQPPRVPLSEEHVRDLIDYRTIVATGAARLACERAQAEDVALLEQLLCEMEHAKTYKVWRRIDSRFHITIAAAAKSPLLVAAEAEIQGIVGAALGDHATRTHVLQVINEQHARIFNAIRDGDATRAMAETQVHVRNTAETLLGGYVTVQRSPANGIDRPRARPLTPNVMPIGTSSWLGGRAGASRPAKGGPEHQQADAR